jgi:hypothetical protein
MPFILDPANGWGDTYNLVEVNGHWLSAYPIVTPVILLPLYIVHMILMLVFQGSYEYYSVLSKACAALIMSFATMLFYDVCAKLFKPRTALVTTFIFAFGTISWAVSSQALWQHGTSELLLVIALLCVVRNECKKDITNFVIIGFVCGLYLFNRPSDIFVFIPVLYYVWLNREFIYAFLFWYCVSAAPFLYYNVAYFGSLFGGYTGVGAAIITNQITIINSISGFIGLFISPNRGLFVFSPILVFSVIGIWYLWLDQDVTLVVKTLLLISIPCMFLSVCFYAAHIDALLGGWCYGPRYLTTIIPILGLFCGFGIQPYVENIDRNKLVVLVIIVLLLISVVVQVIGVLGYPHSEWNQRSGSKDRSRVWDVQDLIIVDSFNSISKTESVSLFIWPTFPPPLGYVVLWEK